MRRGCRICIRVERYWWPRLKWVMGTWRGSLWPGSGCGSCCPPSLAAFFGFPFSRKHPSLGILLVAVDLPGLQRAPWPISFWLDSDNEKGQWRQNMAGCLASDLLLLGSSMVAPCRVLGLPSLPQNNFFWLAHSFNEPSLSPQSMLLCAESFPWAVHFFPLWLTGPWCRHYCPSLNSKMLSVFCCHWPGWLSIFSDMFLRCSLLSTSDSVSYSVSFQMDLLTIT